ncbi:Lsr2 family protein [Rhodococcus sp. BP-252]|uniref:histone-like nucleoid-structuring protein Lsr2 n=1 Tax=unclassified Rhodococcus (in: high G+C Gram-positive bacteria) TaxID=192944 RepID=UPI001C9A75EC|nr:MULTISPECIES: Lsr2 family protein [unclassified Rhodococcus (in: high G+C Gram-positive bacteria)]MBY6412886.1 Lsr2 family protein [Rhodococcus sp. BP-320]MBY6417577.1 Lsr2 family protein [Rhodococcus sp. BP-321]MBY6423051.1 Lsr2 family protein [Rhodococcus sp. BP-324]MBY6427601.1 Lsr2 family protein [Rhodococcus sp. BP-323]MBY6432765.1 Lsr2 family protein [Rhodococcus sp. BP-322]
MARQLITSLIDDIDGSAIDDGSGESIEFAVNGVEYVIDLKTKNANEFHRKLDYYIEYATRVGGRRRKPSAAGTAPASKTSNKAPATSTKRDPAQTRAIRQWAADEGYEISERGRIPADIEEAYNAAH